MDGSQVRLLQIMPAVEDRISFSEPVPGHDPDRVCLAAPFSVGVGGLLRAGPSGSGAGLVGQQEGS